MIPWCETAPPNSTTPPVGAHAAMACSIMATSLRQQFQWRWCPFKYTSMALMLWLD
jgi:hypothetical protein